MKKRFVIMYDYDGTLAPGSIQECFLIKKIRPEFAKNPSEYWKRPNALATTQGADSTLAYLGMIIEDAKEQGIALTLEFLKQCGKRSKPFPGLDTWFKRINAFGEKHGIEVEHYIISTGNYELLVGSPIAKYFKGILGCRYIFEDGVAEGIGVLINEDSKTKHILDLRIPDDLREEYRQGMYIPESLLLPGTNMVFLGDGLTDMRAMNIVNSIGGISFGIYGDDEVSKRRLEVFEKNKNTRKNFNSQKAYLENSSLEKEIFKIIENLENKDSDNKPYQYTIYDFLGTPDARPKESKKEEKEIKNGIKKETRVLS